MNYHNITSDDMNNGDGLRVVLWLAGCSHQCPDCQNRITWDPNGGILFGISAKEEVFASLEKDYINGITLSGGDPLFLQNRKEVTALAKKIKEKFPTKTIWLYTGYLYESVKDLEIMNYVNVLCEGPYIKEFRDASLHWVGSSNQRVMHLHMEERQKKD